MRTISEASALTGVSQRTLHYYDEIGLLPPTKVTEAGYRLYDDDALERLQFILLFREMQFSLREIHRLLNGSEEERNLALERQLELLRAKKMHIENLIDLAGGLRGVGLRHLDFRAFDARQIDAYVARAKEAWRHSDVTREMSEHIARMDQAAIGKVEEAAAEIIRRMGEHVGEAPDSPALHALVAEWQTLLSENVYDCTPQILLQLANMADGGGSVTEELETLGGPGTAAMMAQAIRAYIRCEEKSKESCP